MTNDAPKTSSGESVLYADSDYAGLFRRCAILIVDGAVLMFALFLLFAAWFVVVEQQEEAEARAMLSWLLFVYVYLAILKPSRVRTLGFWLTGVRIVNHKGQRPSVFRMTFRLSLWILGPINPIIDFLWLGGDHHRQTLRDKFAGTYVIKRDATPVGRGKRRAAYYTLMGFTLFFWEIKPV